MYLTSVKICDIVIAEIYYQYLYNTNRIIILIIIVNAISKKSNISFINFFFVNLFLLISLFFIFNIT
ncbi:hypothetical protein Bccel_0940 [Pseudobacteroides cellulosolvens ATCC 35603 = DSM 2933]|uniref:Uncharacterized protein n=1 Tax=Pseudobacteroides cellulosolvens ATCC 35603 = DSM 2933 TaxID=398512 RepID=A0A0L6JIW9_9FIRM|nr:hypothetical protein Bccel_0940 [Pseudobacteroides cellulosolvens ATCC 35603 = DSM 2933]